MRYLRMLSNSVVVGVVATVYVTLLFVLLNLSLPITFGAVAPVAAVVALSYGIHATALTYAAFVVRQLVSLDGLLPAWVSLRMLAWSSGVASGAVALLVWLNAFGYRTALGEEALPMLTAGAAVLAVAGALLLAVALTRTFVQRGPVVVAVTYTLLALTSVGAPLALRDRVVTARAGRPIGPGSGPALLSSAAPGAPRVVVLLLDGASLDVISPAVAAGRLPNFGRMIDGGASMHLATTRPTQPEPVWATVMTGKWPAHHRVSSAAVYRPFIGGRPLEILPDLLFTQALVRFGLLVAEAHTPTSVRATPVWQMLTSHGLPSGIIGLPLTHPAEPLLGFMVSDRLHRRLDPAVDLDQRSAVYPPGIDNVMSPPPGDSGGAAPASPESLALLARSGESAAGVLADNLHHDIAARLAAQQPVRLLVVRYAGLDAVAHRYLRYATPEAFGDVSGQERQQFGRVLDDYYGYVDTLVGDTLASLRDDDVLIVVSGFGMEPLSLGKRLVERFTGNPEISGSHERAPDGFLLAYGRAVSRGRLARGAIVDVTPTLLYFLDQPVGRDMDGFARTDLFGDAFNAQRTITFIPSYDILAPAL